MITEAVFWYIIQAISGIVSIFIAHIVLKYLNKKTLAMRTIFDEIIKDYIYLEILHRLSNILVDILVKFLTPFENYAALIILILHHTIIIAGFCQLIAILIIRYLYVFQLTLLNNEILVIFVTRLLVGCTAIIAALMGDLENSLEYSLLTGQNKENHSYPIWIFLMISLIVLIITDYRIDKFRKSVDSQHQFNEEQEAANAEEEIYCMYYCRKYSLRVLSGILLVPSSACRLLRRLLILLSSFSLEN